jgi:hypothetical protein
VRNTDSNPYLSVRNQATDAQSSVSNLQARKKSVAISPEGKQSEMEIAYSRLNDGQKRRLAKIFESEAESSPANKKKFQYNKNLRTSKYNEFLEESDEEDVFKTKPKTKDGNEYQFDFKIDLYRDMIKYKKTGNDK